MLPLLFTGNIAGNIAGKLLWYKFSPGEIGHDHINQNGNTADLGELMEELQAAWAQDEGIRVASPMKFVRETHKCLSRMGQHLLTKNPDL